MTQASFPPLKDITRPDGPKMRIASIMISRDFSTAAAEDEEDEDESDDNRPSTDAAISSIDGF